MAEKTIVEKAGETVGFGLAMASDVAGSIKTAFAAAVTSVTDVLKKAPAKKAAVKKATQKATAKRAVKKTFEKKPAKTAAAKKLVKKVAVKNVPAKRALKNSVKKPVKNARRK